MGSRMEKRMPTDDIISQLDNLNVTQLKSLVRILTGTVAEYNDFCGVVESLHPNDPTTQLACISMGLVVTEDVSAMLTVVFGADSPGVAEGKAIYRELLEAAASVIGIDVQAIAAIVDVDS